MKYILSIALFISVFLNSYSKVTLLYFNDAHEIAPISDSLGERGGVARIKTIVDSVKQENSNTIVLFGGDLAGGSLFGGVFKGLPIVEAFNRIPVDLANFGQHDFDFGYENTKSLINKSEFKWMSSNLVTGDNNPLTNVLEYQIIQVGRIKIGFIGLTDAMQTTTTAGEIYQKEIINAAKEKIKILSALNVDFFVAITQAPMETNKNLLISVPNIDLIFSEEQYENNSNVFYVGKKPIITTCGNLGSIARAELIKDGKNKYIDIRIYPIDTNVVPNREILKIQNKYQNLLESKLSTKIGYTIVDLDAGINSDFKCRWAESNLGNLITDAFRDYFKTDISFINGGGIRSNITKGDISLKDIYSVLPFGNSICVIKITGKEIWNLVEYGVSSVERMAGHFLQLSGIKIVYNSKNKPGNRVISIISKEKPLELKKKYLVALPDFLLKGGDGFKFNSNEFDIISGLGCKLDRDIAVEYIKKKKIINITTSGRINIRLD